MHIRIFRYFAGRGGFWLPGKTLIESGFEIAGRVGIGLVRDLSTRLLIHRLHYPACLCAGVKLNVGM